MVSLKEEKLMKVIVRIAKGIRNYKIFNKYNVIFSLEIIMSTKSILDSHF